MLEGLQGPAARLLQTVQEKLSGKPSSAAPTEAPQASPADSLDISQQAAAYAKEGAQALALIEEGQRELVELDIKFARMRAEEIKKQIELASFMLAYNGGDSLKALDSYALEIGKSINSLGSQVEMIGRNASQLESLASFRDFAMSSFNSAASEVQGAVTTVTSFKPRYS